MRNGACDALSPSARPPKRLSEKESVVSWSRVTTSERRLASGGTSKNSSSVNSVLEHGVLAGVGRRDGGGWR